MVHGYKGFESDMICQGFQYEVGQTYEHDGNIGLCESGFHFCRKMADVLNYYNGHNCRYAVVEAIGEVINGKDKSVTDRLHIVRELTQEEVFKEMAAGAGISLEYSPFPADEIIQARENGTLDKLLPSGTEFPVRFANGEWNVLVVCRDRDHTYLVTKYLMTEFFTMNNSMTNEGGWPASDMRKHVQEIYGMLPKDVHKAVIPMHIRQLTQGTAVECDDMAFLLSTTNVFGINIWDPSADCDDTQIDIFREASHRKKGRLGASSASWWWLRSANGNINFTSVTTSGDWTGNFANDANGVVVGFCIESRT